MTIAKSGFPVNMSKLAVGIVKIGLEARVRNRKIRVGVNFDMFMKSLNGAFHVVVDKKVH